MQNNRAACAAGRGALAVQIYPATAGRLARAVRRGAGRTVGNRWPDNHKPPDGAPDCAPRSISQQAQPLAGQSTSRRTVRHHRNRWPCRGGVLAICPPWWCWLDCNRWPSRSTSRRTAATVRRHHEPTGKPRNHRRNRPPLRSMPPDGFAPVQPVRRVPVAPCAAPRGDLPRRSIYPASRHRSPSRRHEPPPFAAGRTVGNRAPISPDTVRRII